MWEKLQDVLTKAGATEDEKNAFYTIMMEHVAMAMDELINGLLTDEDFEKLDSMASEEEAKEYVDKRVKEITGKAPQEHSDEIMEGFVAFATEYGYQKILNQS